MKATELYLQLAQACESTASITDLPNKRAGMLVSAAVWRRLAAASLSVEARSDVRRDEKLPAKDLEADALSGSKK